MAQRIRFDQIGEYVEDKFNNLIAAAVLTADQKLKEGSPTDTGRLKISWQVSENVADGQGKPPGKYPNVVTPPDRTNYDQERIGNTYIMYNNIEYAEPVIAGKNLPRSWKTGETKGWRSRNNQIDKNYHLTVAKDVANFIKANAKD
mgnify:FL=1|jgi:hypothetical protein|tara:strand:+ start:295 stop:732 length:438 start_codon:yes stop_codon:yes gene_type:complete